MQPITVYHRTAQYHETDQMGIIHHANYIKWFEEARTDFLDQIGMGYREMEEAGILSPVLSMNCEYKKPVRYGDRVAIHVTIEQFDGCRLTVSYRVEDADTGELRAEGNSRHCLIARDFRPIRLQKVNPQQYETLSKWVGVQL